MANSSDVLIRTIKTVSILGCGWFGTPLASHLVKSGYLIKGSTTSSGKLEQLQNLGIQPYLINIPLPALYGDNSDADFFRCDLLLINLPPKRNSTEAHNYQQKIEQIAQIAVKHQVSEIIFISSTSVYGDHNEEVDEHSFPQPDSPSGCILLETEKHLQSQRSFRTTIIRFGGLVGPNRNPGRFLAGKTNLPNGSAPVNLVHLSDCIGITSEIIRRKAFGHIFNAVAPSHPSRETFYTLAARRWGLPEPRFVPSVGQWKKVSSIRLQPFLNYAFRLPDWEDWI